MEAKIKLEYDDQSGCLYAIIDGKRYGIVQSSGEYTFITPLSEYYWKDSQDYALIVRKLLHDIAKSYNEAHK